MRKNPENGGTGWQGERWAIVSVALMVLSGIMVCSESKACQVTDVWLYLADSNEAAQTSTKTKLFICDANTSYWFRLKWKAMEGGPGDDNEFEGKVLEGSTTLWSDNHIEDIDELPDREIQQEVNEVSDTSALSQGVHTIKAKVCRDDVGDWVYSGECKIAVHADPNEESFWQVITVDDCSAGCSETTWVSDDPCSTSDDIKDDCGYKLTVICFKDPNDACYFKYYYGTISSPLTTLVGVCVWNDGANAFCYRRTSSAWGKHFLETKHNTYNDQHNPPYRGPDPEGEACTGYFCMRCWRHDCFAGSDSKYWRRSLFDWWYPPTGSVDETTWYFGTCPCTPNQHHCCPN
ncbi:MAG TPA: hypothetical protein VMX13_04710 [Sedimentisphaerales bacterium]|nr:hypothetical protein [Sedimentisphaerales bacterium]